MLIRKKPATPEAAQKITGMVQELDLEIRYLPIDSLVAFGRKTRSHTKPQLEDMAKVIGAFGFIVPVIVDEAGKVLAGNGRIEAGRIAGLRFIPVVTITHLTKEQKRQFAIADNRLAELAGWDKATLAIELQELRDLDLSLDIELTGFTDAQVDGLLTSVQFNDTSADRVPLPWPDPVSQVGDLWLMGDHRLICGDATDAAVLDRVLMGDLVRTIFTDPPFNVRVTGNVTRNKVHGEFVMASGEMSDQEFIAFLAKVWANIHRALMPGGLAYTVMDHKHIRHILVAMEGHALDFLNLIVWSKTAAGMGSFYRSQHELVVLAKKQGADHTNRIQLGKNGRNRANVWVYAPTFEFAPFPPRLYSAADLLTGFDLTRPSSYASMFDTKVYAEYMREGGAATANYLTAMTRAIHDNGITQHLADVLHDKKVVAIMGGHSLSRAVPLYGDTARLAAQLTNEGFLVASGGGPAAMEATHLGAAFANDPLNLEAAITYMGAHDVAQPPGSLFDSTTGKINPTVAEMLGKYLAPAVTLIEKHNVHGGVGIPTWMYGYEPFTPFAEHIAKYFQNSIREDGLLAIATHGIIYVQGSAGTLQEVFQDACQNFYTTFPQGAHQTGYASPMVLFGTFWDDGNGYGPRVKPLLEILFKSKPDVAKLVTQTATIAVAVKQITSFKPPPGGNQTIKAVRAQAKRRP